MDVRLFVAILQAHKGSATVKYHATIEQSVQMGCGRQALLVLDTSMAVHGERLALSATQALTGWKRP